MEKTLGRFLKPEERVHHINHVKSDNRPENLTVMLESPHRSMHAKEQRWGASKLTESAILEIRSAYAKQYGFVAETAKNFGVSESAIRHIIKNRSWLDVR